MSSSVYKYCCTGTDLKIRLEGDLKYFRSFSFDTFIEEQFNDTPFVSAQIDLTHADFIDSTNLGLIAKIARLLSEYSDDKVVVYCTNDAILKVLISMGFDTVFDIKNGIDDNEYQYHIIPEGDDSIEHFQKTIYKSHKMLSEMNDKNRDTFKGVIGSLEQTSKQSKK